MHQIYCWLVAVILSTRQISPLVWEPLGCYKDSRVRSMPHYFGTVTYNKSNPDYKDIFEQCRGRAEAHGYTYFGVQFMKECWGSTNARETYNNHGCNNNCQRGVSGYGGGGDWSNYVYRVKEVWTECIALECVQYKIVLVPEVGSLCPVTNRNVGISNETRACPNPSECAVNGNWSTYSTWSQCTKTCDGGVETRTRTCTNPAPANGGNNCTGSALETRACALVACAPKRCTIDDILKFATDVLPGGKVEINNQFIGALRQVIRGLETGKGMPANLRINKDELVDRIKKAMDHKGYIYARTMLGYLLHKVENCHTNGDKIIKKVKDAIGEEKFKDFLAVDGDVSLVFAIDTSGSMTQEIPQAKALVKAVADYKRKGKVDFILSPYNDPDCGPVKKFSKIAQFRNAIDDLRAYGGGDCQEPTFRGIIDAIEEGAPLATSPLYVFTDAPSKAVGFHSSDTSIGLALEHMMHINFFFSRYGCADPRNDLQYSYAIEDTGGLELFFKSPLSFLKAESVVKADLDGSTIVASGGSFGVRGGMKVVPQRIDFPVDKTMRRLIVSISAKSHSGSVSLLDPAGNSVPNPLMMYKGNLWVMESPANGTWTLTSQPNVKGLSYMIKASAPSNIDFDHVFVRVLQPTGEQVQIRNPLEGEKAKAKIIIPLMSRLNSSSLRLHLVNEDGGVISLLTLNDSFASFDLPSSDSFRFRLTGSTRDGDRFMRTSRDIRPMPAVIRVQILGDLHRIKPGTISYFRAMIDRASPGSRRFRLKGSSFTPGVSLSLRRSVSVTRARPGYIPVFVVTRRSVAVGTIAKVQITAKSGDATINLLANLMVT